MFITQQEHFPPHRAEGHRRHDGAAAARGDGAGADDLLGADAPAPGSSASSPSRWCTAPPAARRSASRRTCGRRPATGSDFDLSAEPLEPLEPFRDYLTIVSNTDVRNAEAFTAPEIGGDHFRSSAVFLTQSHPQADAGLGRPRRHVDRSDLRARSYGQDTPIPSMQLCIENVDQSGGCSYGYSCAYTDSISWASPDQPLPMIRDPRVVFDQLFGVGATPAERRERRAEDRSILDWLGTLDRRGCRRISAPRIARA